MVTDRVGDFIIRLKNAGAVKLGVVSLRHSKLLENISEKLKTLGYLSSVEVSRKEPKMLTVTLVYDTHGVSAIHGVKRISKPGRRLYTGSDSAHGVKNGFGSRILSTPKGILTDVEARNVHAGGEEMFEIW